MPTADHLLVVAGERVPAVEGGTTTVLAPATGEPLATVARAGAPDVERAVATAHAAFADGRGAWPATSATVRGRVLGRVADLLRERASDLARLEAENAGHPIGDAEWEVEAAARTFEFHAAHQVVQHRLGSRLVTRQWNSLLTSHRVAITPPPLP